MSEYQLKDLQLLFTTGSLRSAVVAAAPMKKGYTLFIDDKFFLFAQRGGIRHFSSIDAACKAAENIGFKSITVKLDALK